MVRLRTNIPAAISNTNDTATCAVTSILPTGILRYADSSVPPAAVDFSTGDRSTRVERSAGINPNRIAVSAAIAMVNTRIRPSS